MRQLFGDFSRLVSRRVKRRFVLLAIASTLVSALDAIGIILLVPLVDVLARAKDGSVPHAHLAAIGDVSVGVIVVGVVVFFIAKSVGMAVLRWWSAGVVLDASSSIAGQLFAAYMAAPIGFHDRRNTADSVRTLASSVDSVFRGGLMSAATGVAELASLLVLGTVVVIVSPIAAVAGLVYFAGASLVYLKIFQRRVHSRARQGEQVYAESIQSIQEGLGGLREHRVRRSEAGLITKFTDQRRKLAATQRFSTFALELSRYYLEILFIGGFGVIIAAVLVSSSKSALTTVAVMLAVGFRVLPSLSRVLTSVTGVRLGRAALEVVLEDLDEMGLEHLEAAGDVAPEAIVENGANGPRRLRLERVTFSYDGAVVPALAAVTLSVAPGRSLGVVGPSGAGKSTLVDVVCGLRVPQGGEIWVDDVQVTAESNGWGRSIGLVPQNVYLIDASVARNVAFGLPIDEDRIWEALRRAQLAEFVSAAPQGLEMIVGERGARLSGGQRQRLGIARALYVRPSVLVLDEATAALDVETEAAVVEAVGELTGQLSLIVVAHRLSTIRRCDSVAYLDSGRVRAVGTFDEVAQKVPEFARAIDLAGLTPFVAATTQAIESPLGFLLPAERL